MVTFTVKGATRARRDRPRPRSSCRRCWARSTSPSPRPGSGPPGRRPGDPAVPDHAVVRRRRRVLRPDDDDRADRLRPAGHVAGDPVDRVQGQPGRRQGLARRPVPALPHGRLAGRRSCGSCSSRASAVSGTVASRNAQVASLIQDGDALLQELDAAAGRDPHALPQHLAAGRSSSPGWCRTTGPSCSPPWPSCTRCSPRCRPRTTSLSKGVQTLAPFTRVFANALGNGPWFDACVPNLVVPVGRPGPAVGRLPRRWCQVNGAVPRTRAGQG